MKKQAKKKKTKELKPVPMSYVNSNKTYDKNKTGHATI